MHLIASSSEDHQTYMSGLDFYKNKQYQESYQLFSKIYLNHLEDASFNYMLGRSAYEIGNYSIALAAFERVEMQDSGNLVNRLEMARTYFMLKMYEDAQNAFEDVLNNPNIPQNVRANIEVALSQVSKVQEKSFTYARIMANILYDSNVNYGSIDDYQYGNGLLSKVEERADLATEVYANVTNIYDIGEKNGFAVKNSLSFYNKEYFEEDEYGLTYLTYNPSLVYKETKFLTELSLGADVLYLGGEKYLSTTSISPSLHYFHTPTLSSLAYVKYLKRDFQQEAQNELSANRVEISYGLQNILTPRSYLKGDLFFINESKISGNNIYVNFDEYKTNLSYTNLFTSEYSLELLGQVRMRKYKDYSTGFGSRREDLGTLAIGSFTYTILPTLRANIKTSYEHINSNQGRFSYGKYIVSAGLVKTF